MPKVQHAKWCNGWSKGCQQTITPQEVKAFKRSVCDNCFEKGNYVTWTDHEKQKKKEAT